MTDEKPSFTIVQFACHLCSEKGFADVYQLRDHWHRDHNYNVTIRIKP
jgi:hypothetical protein